MTIAVSNSGAQHRSRSRQSYLASGVCGLLGLLSACDDTTNVIGTGVGGSGGSTTSGGSGGGEMNGGGGGGGAVDAGSSAGAANLDAGSIDRNVFRPEERAATGDLIATLRAPAGFSVTAFAEGLGEARMLVARGPFVYVTRPTEGDVLRLQDTDGDGVADDRETVVAQLPLVHGIVFRGDQVYLATDTRLLTASVDSNGLIGALNPIIEDLPDGGQHPRRTLGIGPDDQLYISVGSSCDACEESNPQHATMLRATLDGTSRSIFASGLRNTIGFGWHPQTDQLWGMDHGSDWRGDDLPPEELNAINLGENYGWPYCYGDRQIDPVIQDPPSGSKAAYCAATATPTLQARAHEAPIGMVFYSGIGFPAEYQGDAFVAMHGSWNRFPPTGYKVVRIVYDAGVPQRFEDFVTGFLIEGGGATFGRPAGITVGADGSLLFSDDSNGVLYRVRHVSASQPDAGEPAPDAGTAPDGGDSGI